MEFPSMGTVAFVVAWVAFFTNQFNLKGNIALLCAFLVALFFGIAPLISEAYPIIARALDIVLNTVMLTVSAAGGYNIIMKVASKAGGLR